MGSKQIRCVQHEHLKSSTSNLRVHGYFLKRSNGPHGCELYNFAPDTHELNWKSLITGCSNRSFFNVNPCLGRLRPSTVGSIHIQLQQLRWWQCRFGTVMVARIKSRPCTSFHHESGQTVYIHLFAYISDIAHLYNENFFRFVVPSRRRDKRAEYEWGLFSFFTRLHHPHLLEL